MERKFKYGDRVWDKRESCVVGFNSYHPDGIHATVTNGVCSVVYKLTDIEPYIDQDFQMLLDNIRDRLTKEYNKGIKDTLKKPSPKHPFTIILKSGIKIGVDEQTARGISVVSGETVHQIDGTHYFVKSEIAAIVPSENILE